MRNSSQIVKPHPTLWYSGANANQKCAEYTRTGFHWFPDLHQQAAKSSVIPTTANKTTFPVGATPSCTPYTPCPYPACPVKKEVIFPIRRRMKREPKPRPHLQLHALLLFARTANILHNPSLFTFLIDGEEENQMQTQGWLPHGGVN